MRTLTLMSFLLIGLSLPYFYYKNKKEVKTSNFFSESSLEEESFQDSDPFQKELSHEDSSENKNPEKKGLESSILAKKNLGEDSVSYQDEEVFVTHFSEEELNQYFTKPDEEEGAYSYSESLFAYPRDAFDRESYNKDQIVYETTELVFVKPDETDQRPEKSYQVIKKPSGKLAVFLESVIITARNKQWHREKVRSFLKEKNLSYKISSPGVFVISVSEVSKAFEIKNSLKEIQNVCKKIVLDMRSHFHRPGG